MTTINTMCITRSFMTCKAKVEVTMEEGIGIQFTGSMTDIAIKECLLRVTTALTERGWKIPGKKIVINMRGTDGFASMYDLPIALGILVESGQVLVSNLDKYIVAGEVGLGSELRPLPPGIGAMVADYAQQANFEGCVLPEFTALEATGYTNIKVLSADTIGKSIIALNTPRDNTVWRSRRYIDTTAKMDE